MMRRTSHKVFLISVLLSVTALVGFGTGNTNIASANTASASITPSLMSQVPYSALKTLPTSAYNERFSYGVTPLNIVEVWHSQQVQTEFAKTAIIFVHGGCWLNAYDLSHAYGFYNALAQQGIGVFALEYRRAGDEGGGWPGSLDDVKQGISDVLARVNTDERYNKVYVVGHSAGGHLALLATQTFSKSAEDFKKLKGVIGLAAITDITRYAEGTNSCQSATTQFMNGTAQALPKAYQDATPTQMRNGVPVLLMHGDDDHIVPLHHASHFDEGKIVIAKGGHFDWLHPESASFHALLDVLKRESL